jgi:hypothetical protein
VDIGGPMAIYNVSSKPQDGYYQLEVSPSGMSHMSLKVRVVNTDRIEIYQDAELLYDLEQQ